MYFIDKYIYEFSIDLYENYNVKFIDCMIASIAQIQKGEMTIISYDKALFSILIYKDKGTYFKIQRGLVAVISRIYMSQSAMAMLCGF